MSNAFTIGHNSDIVKAMRKEDKYVRSSKTLTKHVEQKRKSNPTYGTVYGIGQLPDSIAEKDKP